jgi:predicted nucleic acid-binding protein
MASAVQKHYSDCAQTNASGAKLYLDTSALVKLIVAEPESRALSDYLHRFADDDLFTAALARTELVRAVADGGAPAITEARALLDSIDTVALSRACSMTRRHCHRRCLPRSTLSTSQQHSGLAAHCGRW